MLWWDFFFLFFLIFLTSHSFCGCKQLNSLCCAFDSNVRKCSWSFLFEKFLHFCHYLICFNLLILTLAHPLCKQPWKLSFDVLRTHSCLLNKWPRVFCDVNVIAERRRRFQNGFVKHVLARFSFTVVWYLGVGTWSEIAGAGSLYLLFLHGNWCICYFLRRVCIEALERNTS